MILFAGATEITTERLRLRAPRQRDLRALHEAIAETLPELVRWLPWAHAAHERADTVGYLRNAKLARGQRVALEFIVEEASTGALLGIVSAHRIDWVRRCAGVGYWIRRSSWGKQVATEATRGLALHAFRDLDLHRLEAQVAPGNVASQRVVEKVGFRREGIAREFEFVNGRYLDHVQYSLLRWEMIADPRGPA